MKKPKLSVEDPQPRNIQRADIAPSDGYSLVVRWAFQDAVCGKSSRSEGSNRVACEVSDVAGRNLRRIVEITSLG